LQDKIKAMKVREVKIDLNMVEHYLKPRYPIPHDNGACDF